MNISSHSADNYLTLTLATEVTKGYRIKFESRVRVSSSSSS